MIRYALRCTSDHDFDSWFASAEAYERLATAGGLSCPVCGSGDVAKAVMAPQVSGGGGRIAEHPLARLRRKIEAEADYVGDRFATEARAIHDGDAPGRPIWGEARPEDARALAEDGIAVAPLPFAHRSKAN